MLNELNARDDKFSCVFVQLSHSSSKTARVAPCRLLVGCHANGDDVMDESSVRQFQ